MKIFYTSDQHFGHSNIIRYCGRPYADVAEMGRDMIRRWNEAVGPQDTVWHLGDFGFGHVEHLRDILASLNGVKYLVRGNHDGTTARCRRLGFAEVYERATVSDGGVTWTLVHDSAGVHGAARILCGHAHEKWARRDSPLRTAINVGVDVRGFAPRTLGELLDWTDPGITASPRAGA